MILRPALTIAGKDLHLVALRSTGLVQAQLFGLLLFIFFILTADPWQQLNSQTVAMIFWLASVFCQVVVFNALYSVEEVDAARLTLLVAPISLHAIWLGKALAGILFIAAAQGVFLPAILVCLGQDMEALPLLGLAAVGLVDLGLVAMGSLLGALSQGQSTRESLLSVILFPLLVPLLLAGVRLGASALSGVRVEESATWLGLAAAFDALFCGASLLLFPFVYSVEE